MAKYSTKDSLSAKKPTEHEELSHQQKLKRLIFSVSDQISFVFFIHLRTKATISSRFKSHLCQRNRKRCFCSKSKRNYFEEREESYRKSVSRVPEGSQKISQVDKANVVNQKGKSKQKLIRFCSRVIALLN